MRTRKMIHTAWSLAAITLGMLLTAGTARGQEEDRRYGYLRVLEGPAVQVESQSDDGGGEATINQPLLAGDRLLVPERGRVEAVLADGNIVRLDGGSEVTFTRLAASADTEDRASVLTLDAGHLQILVRDDARGEDFPRVETANATIFIEAYGSYRITADGDLSEVVVRRGRARVVTEGEEVTVRAEERAVIEGETDGEGRDRLAEVSVSVEEAGPADALERWGRRLDEDALAENDDLGAIDSDYRYEAAALADHGSWITVESRRYWRPRVADDWRPYWQGRWVSTPSGLTWISSEPWGWLPAHYGTWDYLPAYGWIWQPGYVYSPAWVYWYWGPSQVGWCPTGYYTRHYGNRYGRDASFRFGVYGWAGGHWGDYSDWNFVAFNHFRERDLRRHARRGRDFDGTGRHAVPRGIITTDTRGLTPGIWDKPQRVTQVLTERRRRQGGRDGQAGDLPDVTSFVSRKPLTPTEVTAVVDRKPNGRLRGTPLDPATLGTVPARIDRGDRGGRGERAAGPLDKPIAGGRDAGNGRNAREGDQPWRSHQAGGNGDKPLRRPEAGADGGTPRAGSRAPREPRDPMTGGVAVQPRDPAVNDGGRSGRARPEPRGEAEPWISHRADTGGEKPLRPSRRPAAGSDGGTPRAGRTQDPAASRPSPGVAADQPWRTHTSPGAGRGQAGSAATAEPPSRRERSYPRSPQAEEAPRGGRSGGYSGDSPSARDKPATGDSGRGGRSYTPRSEPAPSPRAGSRSERSPAPSSPPSTSSDSERSSRRGGGQARGNDGKDGGGHQGGREAGSSSSSRSGGGSRRGGGRPPAN